MIVGFPGRDRRRTFGGISTYLPGSPLTHLHVFPYSDRPGTEATAHEDKVDGVTIRERGACGCATSARPDAAFPRLARSAPCVPGLTLEDGSLVVTDNYLKVRIPPGMRARNERVDA